MKENNKKEDELKFLSFNDKGFENKNSSSGSCIS